MGLFAFFMCTLTTCFHSFDNFAEVTRQNQVKTENDPSKLSWDKMTISLDEIR